MNIKPVTYSYKRQIERGFKTFLQVIGVDIKEQLRLLWGAEVENKELSREKYRSYTGENYLEEFEEKNHLK